MYHISVIMYQLFKKYYFFFLCSCPPLLCFSLKLTTRSFHTLPPLVPDYRGKEGAGGGLTERSIVILLLSR